MQRNTRARKRERARARARTSKCMCARASSSARARASEDVHGRVQRRACVDLREVHTGVRARVRARECARARA
eukprot:6172076-Pleurochrysis_carterae.AAC.2